MEAPTPSSMVQDVSAILQGITQTREKLRAQQASLARHFEEMLSKSLAVRTIVDANSVDSPAYHAKAVSGRAYRPVYRIEGLLRVKVDANAPILSKWRVNAISIDYDGKRTLGKQLELEGMVFPLQSMSVEPDINYIVRMVQKYEAAQ